jgi:hypothetical protein
MDDVVKKSKRVKATRAENPQHARCARVGQSEAFEAPPRARACEGTSVGAYERYVDRERARERKGTCGKAPRRERHRYAAPLGARERCSTLARHTAVVAEERSVEIDREQAPMVL